MMDQSSIMVNDSMISGAGGAGNFFGSQIDSTDIKETILGALYDPAAVQVIETGPNSANPSTGPDNAPSATPTGGAVKVRGWKERLEMLRK